MTRITAFLVCLILFISYSYQSVITVLPNSSSTKNPVKFNTTTKLTNHPNKLTKEEETEFRKAIAHELENKTVLNAASNFLSAYFRKNVGSSNAQLLENYNKKSLKQKYRLRTSTPTTTENWDQSLEDNIPLATSKTIQITRTTSAAPTPVPPPITDLAKEKNNYDLKAIPESTSKKYEVLTLYVAPPPPPVYAETQPPPPPPQPPKPQYQPYRPSYQPTYHGPTTTPVPWYRHAPNLFDSEQVVPIFTDILVSNINNGNLSAFLLNRLVDFSKTDGPAKVAANILDLIF